MDDLKRTLKLLELRAKNALSTASSAPSAGLFLASLEETRTRLDTLMEQFNRLDDDQVDTLIERCMQAINVVDEADALASAKNNTRSSASDSSHSSAPDLLRLPAMNLPTFSGRITEWPTFSQLFEDAMAAYPAMTSSQKMQYLNQSLTGDAKQVIQFFTTQPNAFEQAWERLTEKFNRHLDIINGLLAQVFEFPPCKLPTDLEKLADKCIETRRGLELLQLPADEGQNHIWNYVLTSKMDAETRSTWSLKADQDQIPQTKDVLDFLYRQARVAPHKGYVPTTSASHSMRSQPPQRTNSSRKCPECHLDHPFYKCSTYTKGNTDEKWGLVKKHKLCGNCLNSGHLPSACNFGPCKQCPKKHHTSLHRSPAQVASTSSAVNAVITDSEPTEQTTSLLGSIRVSIPDIHGKPVQIRALLDTGAQVSLISASAAKRLQLPLHPPELSIIAVNGTSTPPVHIIHCNLMSKYENVPLKAHILNNISCPQPSSAVPLDALTALIKDKILADPEFNRPGPIDMILGLDTYGAIVQATPTQRIGNIFALETIFGWVLYGSVPTNTPIKTATVNQVSHSILTKFWEVESCPETIFPTKEDKMVEKFVENSTTRLSNGKFAVRMPLLSDPPQLGASRHVAVKRLLALENRFSKDPTYAQMYKDVIAEYIELGHLEPAPPEPENTHRVAYLPHHGVLKNDRTSTKLRVVFDGSAKSSNGRSLNENQPAGPKLQNNILNVLLRFRSHPIALTADISKMYRQVHIQQEDRDLQRIVWRADTTAPIQDMRLTTVTFGQRVAPYLAIKALHMVADNCNDPEVSKIIKEEFYVDDLLSGAQTAQEAASLQSRLRQALDEAGFPTHKWTSNAPSALAHLRDAGNDSVLLASEKDNHGTLGLLWDPKGDTFTISLSPVSDTTKKKWTRRSVLSAANGLYDPIGLIAPATLVPKIIMQSITKDNTDWDKPLTKKQQEEWTTWYGSLHMLKNFSTPRCVTPPNSQTTLCGFCDASERGYGAVIYAVSAHHDNTHNVVLVTSKTKVAPLKTQSLPRLELLGALLLTRLMKLTTSVLENVTDIHVYTDSTIVLGWLAGHPSRWSTFVANRVAEIQETLPAPCWQHVKSQDNPADLASRGLNPAELPNATLWWQGPPWLQNTFDSGSKPEQRPAEIEVRKQAVFAVTTQPTSDVTNLLKRFSSYTKLQRVIALVLRFVDKTRQKITSRVEELRQASHHINRWVQIQSFPEEHAALKARRPVKLTSPLAALNPFIKDGVIRVGGRLQNASIPYESKHPVILPSDHYITELLIRHTHIINMHSGASATSHHIRQTYWILAATSTVKKIVKNCIICAKCKAKLASQMMAALPTVRVRQVTRPFYNCGVDFAGPFTLKTQLSRGSKTYKSYISLFICMTTRAIHLEVVNSLSSASFLAALARFTSRRGLPWQMMSDNGTNFVGALKELRQIIHSQELQDAVAQKGVLWKFNPPAAPHFGGMWEAGVKSTKYHLHRVVGQQILTYEEFATVLCKVEAMLNSRPLSPLSDDPSDLTVLTPAHFLIGAPLTAVPETDLTAEKINTLTRWQLVQRVTQDIWKRWSTEFMSRLQQRPKWLRKQANITLNSLVIINDPNRHPLEWRLGRVTQLHPANDQNVRVVTLKTAYGPVTRPIHKLCILPLDEQAQPEAQAAVKAQPEVQAAVKAQPEVQTQPQPTLPRRSSRIAKRNIK